ncbi:MAG TPA: glycosyltransferase family 87 protein [Candidatus Obscuribacterales bacterium]
MIEQQRSTGRSLASTTFLYLFITLLLTIPAVALRPPSTDLFRITDFPNYYAAAHLYVSGQSALAYDREALRKTESTFFPDIGQNIRPVNLPPFVLPLLAPLAAIPAEQFSLVWHALLVLSTAAAVLIIARAVHLTGRQTLLLAAFVAVCGPQWEAVRCGQITGILLMLYAGCVHSLRSGRTERAALFMAGLLLKPHELLPTVAFMAGARRFRFCVIIALVGLALAAASLICSGPEVYARYLQFMPESFEVTDVVNPTIRGQFMYLFPTVEPYWSRAVGLGAFILSLISLMVLGARLAATPACLDYAIMASMPVGLIAAPHLHNYDLLLILPAAILSFQAFKGEVVSASLCLFACLCFLPVYMYVHYQFPKLGLAVNPIFFSLAAFVLALVLRLWSAPQQAATK